MSMSLETCPRQPQPAIIVPHTARSTGRIDVLAALIDAIHHPELYLISERDGGLHIEMREQGGKPALM